LRGGLVLQTKEKRMKGEKEKNDPPTCRRCGAVAKRGKALQNLFSGRSEWSDGSMGGATMSLSGAARLIDCWKCTNPTCGQSWT
jgi:hypothetical protein